MYVVRMHEDTTSAREKGWQTFESSWPQLQFYVPSLDVEGRHLPKTVCRSICYLLVKGNTSPAYLHNTLTGFNGEILIYLQKKAHIAVAIGGREAVKGG